MHLKKIIPGFTVVNDDKPFNHFYISIALLVILWFQFVLTVIMLAYSCKSVQYLQKANIQDSTSSDKIVYNIGRIE